MSDNNEFLLIKLDKPLTIPEQGTIVLAALSLLPLAGVALLRRRR